MAEEKKKDNFALIVGVCAVLSITLVMVLKQRETEHLEMETARTVQEEATLFEGRKDFNNVMVE